MPFGIQPIHLVIIVVVALLIFGPRRLPEMGRGIGRAINEFRKGTQEMTESLREEITKPGEADPSPVKTTPQPQPAAAGNFCGKCGNGNSPEASFCNKCGAKLSV